MRLNWWLCAGFSAWWFVPAVAVFLALAMPAQGAVTLQDVQVAARVLGFTANPPSGAVRLGIVYDPANAASVADEHELAGILGAGLAVGGVTLVPVPVTMRKLGSVPMDVVFLTGGLGSEAAQAEAFVEQKKMLCMTTDMAATAAGNCALGIQTEPKVAITLNAAAASDSDVSFAAAFVLMITEI
jgi:hypothetical protein